MGDSFKIDGGIWENNKSHVTDVMRRNATPTRWVGINILTWAGWRDCGIEVKTEAELTTPLLDPQR